MEYLKMADASIDSVQQGEWGLYLLDGKDNLLAEFRDGNENICSYVVHAVKHHDELVNKNDTLTLAFRDAVITADSNKKIANAFMSIARDMVTMLNMAGTEKEKDSINPFSHWLWLAEESLEAYGFIGDESND